MKNTIARISIWIALKINKFRQKLEVKKHMRITMDIVNLESRERKQVLAKMRYRFRKNKKRGAFIYNWCDDMEYLGDQLDSERAKHGDTIKIKNLKPEKDELR